MALFLELYGQFVLNLHIISSSVLVLILLVFVRLFWRCPRLSTKQERFKAYFRYYKFFFISNGILLFLIGLSGVLLFVAYGYNEIDDFLADSKLYIYFGLFLNLIFTAVKLKKAKFLLRYAYIHIALKRLKNLSIYMLASQLVLSLASVFVGLKL